LTVLQQQVLAIINIKNKLEVVDNQALSIKQGGGLSEAD
jgi:hypothetical protein